MAFTGDHIPETQSLTPSCPSTVISVAVRRGNKLLLARSLGEHLRLSQGRCPTSLDDTPSRENALDFVECYDPAVEDAGLIDAALFCPFGYNLRTGRPGSWSSMQKQGECFENGQRACHGNRGGRAAVYTEPDVQISRFRFFMGEPRSQWCNDGQFEVLGEDSASIGTRWTRAKASFVGSSNFCPQRSDGLVWFTPVASSLRTPPSRLGVGRGARASPSRPRAL
jgi:hypothetical protein